MEHLKISTVKVVVTSSPSSPCELKNALTEFLQICHKLSTWTL